MPLAEVERRAILNALRVSRDNVAAAAVLLQVSPATIYRKLKTYGIDRSSGS